LPRSKENKTIFYWKVRIHFRITPPALGQSIDKKWLDGWGAETCHST
jgi:hypothetical protein